MTKKMNAVKVTQPEPPVPAEVMADAIVTIAKSMKAIDGTRLKREALVALIHDNSRITKTTIRIVLNNLDDLEQIFLKPKKAKT